MKPEPLTITPHFGDHMRDRFHAMPIPNKLQLVQLFVTGAILAAVALAIIVNQ